MCLCKVTIQSLLASQAALPNLQSFCCVSITLTAASHLCLIFPSPYFPVPQHSFIPFSSFLFASGKLICRQLAPTMEM